MEKHELGLTVKQLRKVIKGMSSDAVVTVKNGDCIYLDQTNIVSPARGNVVNGNDIYLVKSMSLFPNLPNPFRHVEVQLLKK